MVYVHHVEKAKGKIELTLGFSSWTGSNRNIKYYSVDELFDGLDVNSIKQKGGNV